jgi:hypothetical protein
MCSMLSGASKILPVVLFASAGVVHAAASTCESLATLKLDNTVLTTAQSISCLEFQRRRLPFKSVMVHQDSESGIGRKDRTRSTNAADKQFTSLDDFRETGPQFFERERAA